MYVFLFATYSKIQTIFLSSKKEGWPYYLYFICKAKSLSQKRLPKIIFVFLNYMKIANPNMLSSLAISLPDHNEIWQKSLVYTTILKPMAKGLK